MLLRCVVSLLMPEPESIIVVFPFS
jgi:hypothetical protein